jgi:hypothetical protein
MVAPDAYLKFKRSNNKGKVYCEVMSCEYRMDTVRTKFVWKTGRRKHRCVIFSGSGMLQRNVKMPEINAAVGHQNFQDGPNSGPTTASKKEQLIHSRKNKTDKSSLPKNKSVK